VALGHLTNSPLFEVVCGALFEEPCDLDPIRVGLFWAAERARYARHELHPAIRDGAGFHLLQGVGPVRSWLVSADEDYVLQIQPDRVYFNWRRRGGTYPRFNTYGEQKGVLERFVDELARVRTFCSKELGVSLGLHTVELAKIDHIPFDGFDDLVTLVPCLSGLRDLGQTRFPEVGSTLSETLGAVKLRTGLSTIVSPELTPALRCDILARRPLVRNEAPEAALRELNEILNATFERLVSEAALVRFGATPKR
jgi:uncharacterized protein (TIGR04255 family)